MYSAACRRPPRRLAAAACNTLHSHSVWRWMCRVPSQACSASTQPPATSAQPPATSPPTLPRLTRAGTTLGQVVVVNHVDDADAAVSLLEDDLQPDVCANGGHGAVVGFDTEWPPRAKGAPQPPTALLQLSSGRVAVLLRLCKWRRAAGLSPDAPLRCPPRLASLLQDAAVLKVGQAIGGEAADVSVELGLGTNPIRGAVDTAHLAARLGKLDFPTGLWLAQQLLVRGGVSRVTCATLLGAALWGEPGTDLHGEPVRVGLKSLSRRYLHRELHKPHMVQRSQWDLPRLSRRQLDYAALDAWVSRAVFLVMANRYRAAHAPGLSAGSPWVDVASHSGSLCSTAVRRRERMGEDVGPCRFCDMPTKVEAFRAASGQWPTTALSVACMKLGLPPAAWEEVDRVADGATVRVFIPAPHGADGPQCPSAVNAVPCGRAADARQVSALRLYHSLCAGRAARRRVLPATSGSRGSATCQSPAPAQPAKSRLWQYCQKHGLPPPQVLHSRSRTFVHPNPVVNDTCTVALGSLPPVVVVDPPAELRKAKDREAQACEQVLAMVQA